MSWGVAQCERRIAMRGILIAVLVVIVLAGIAKANFDQVDWLDIGLGMAVGTIAGRLAYGCFDEGE
jgi:uncharacterized membrane protein YcaP (DUF421 family)